MLNSEQEYIRHLLFVVLREDTIADVLRKLLKLPWAECEKYVLKCMLKVGSGCRLCHAVRFENRTTATERLQVVRGRASNLPLIISLAYGLAQYYESLGIAMVSCS